MGQLSVLKLDLLLKCKKMPCYFVVRFIRIIALLKNYSTRMSITEVTELTNAEKDYVHTHLIQVR